MEITNTSFYGALLSILVDIAESEFVSIDFEFSGIARSQWKSPSENRKLKGRPTVQERYKETRDAAEKYKILQFGLTTAKRESSGAFTLSTYNFNVNPVVQCGLQLERIFSCQSTALEFLTRHGFKFDEVFRDGVQYLSRVEEERLRQDEAMRAAKLGRDLIAVDLESEPFVESIRSKVDAWLHDASNHDDFLNISAPGSSPDPFNTANMTNYQKKLVHQTIESEYPSLMTRGRHNFVQIQRRNEAFEAKKAATDKEFFDKQVIQQIGLRWIIEALIGGSLSPIDPMLCARNLEGDLSEIDLEVCKEQLNSIEAILRRKRPVLVGHNLFTDLIYLHTQFIGPLDDTIEDFQNSIHLYFPRVLDTKYLFTAVPGSSSDKSVLQDIDIQLKDQTWPRIENKSTATGYGSGSSIHEAGYDSFLTARIAIRLAAKFFRENLVVDTTYRPATPSTPYVRGHRLTPSRLSGGAAHFVPTSPQGTPNSGLPLASPSYFPPPFSNALSQYARPTTPLDRPPSRLHRRMYSDFSDMERPMTPLSDMDGGGVRLSESSESLSTLLDRATIQDRNSREMPNFENPFWNQYMNVLRVFGTVEQKVMLDDASPNGF